MNHFNTIEQFVQKQRELLKLEQDEEVAERHQIYESKSVKELVKRGICVNRLQLDHQRTGLFGKHVVVFNLNSNEITSHQLSSGDIVGLYPNKGASGDIIASGLVSSSRSRTISVAFIEALDLPSSSLFRLMKLTNDVTYRRLNKALQEISKLNSDTSNFLKILFPCKPVDDRLINPKIQINKFFNGQLDTSQRDAVTFAISSSLPLSVIHGPPGTGKTTTVVEIVQQQVKNFHKKILVCAPSNIAVDNLVDRLARVKVKVVRLGHPARVIEDVQKYSLDAIIDSHDSSDVIRELKAEISTKCSSKVKGGSKQKWDDVKLLRKDLVKREQQLTASILTTADVVLSTLTSALKEGPLKFVKDGHFDLLIIDEAAQALEVSCWIPLLKVNRCILAGDHLQLPPTIISDKAAKAGLEVTLLERVVNGLGENAVQMLTMQYRMNQLIMEWPSGELYENKLKAAEMVKDHLLCHLEGVQDTENTQNALVFVDTAGCDMHELNNQEEESKGNPWEVDIVFKHIEQLVKDGVQMQHIGVITPYNLQVDLIRKAVLPHFPQVEVNSVDGFQGREKEAILISLVRSNEDGKVGFLREDRRLNVAVTRARRHLFVVGDTATISRHPFLESFSTYMFEKAVVRSPLLLGDGGGTDSKNASTSSAAAKTLPDLSRFELPVDLTTRTDIAKTLSQEKQRVNKQKLKKEYLMGDDDNHAEKKQNQSSKEGNIHDETTKRTQQQEQQQQQTQKDQQQRECLEKQINDFLSCTTNSNRQTKTRKKLEFPATLTSRERAWVHEMSEASGLLEHESVGEGNRRHIVIWKKKTTEDDRDGQLKEKNKDTEKPESHVTCPTCKAQVPKDNLQLHSIRCSRLLQQQQQDSEKEHTSEARPSNAQKSSTTSSSATTKKKKSKTKTTNNNSSNKQSNKGHSKDPKKQSEEEDIDSILDEFKRLNNTCGYALAHAQCKNSIKMLGQKCEFCGLVFCLTHHIAEVHGCGDAVRIKARQDHAKYAVGGVASCSRPKPMKSATKAHVQRKLDKKLDDLQSDRKKKDKKK